MLAPKLEANIALKKKDNQEIHISTGMYNYWSSMMQSFLFVIFVH